MNGQRGLRVALLCDQRGDEVAGTDTRRRVLSVSVTGRPAVIKKLVDIDALRVTQPEFAALLNCPSPP